MKSKSCLVFSLLASLVLCLRADYEVKVQLFTFENPTHQFPRVEGSVPPAYCCDGLGQRDPCTDDICDVYIIFCLNPFELLFDDDSLTNCEPDTRVSGIFTTPNSTMNVDNITFDVGETALLGLPNPFIIHQTGEWPGGIQLVVHVFDDDSNGVSDNDDSLQRIIIDIDSLGTSPPELIMGAVAMTNVSYEVACAENFFGSDCATFCDDDLGPYTCGSNGERICNDNYYGPNCTIFCEERDDAQGHYICNDEGNIMCREGYNDTSTNCTECIPAVGCSPVGGFCREGNECLCDPEYTGDLCESDLNVCRQTTLCQNGGTCTNIGPDMYNCSCIEGFEGVNCEFTVTDECDPDPCENGATCMDLFMNYTCECVDGYEGNNCEIDINECDNNPCMNGSCIDLVAGYNCTCAEGYEGEDCSQETDECINQLEPCRNGATCVDLFLNYMCECADGYEGRDCGVESNECDSNLCQNGGSCTDLVADYNCSCLPGFIGKNCEREESEGSSMSSEGVDVGTLAGGVVGIILLVIMILVLVVILVFLLRKGRHKKIQFVNEGVHQEPAEYEVFSKTTGDNVGAQNPNTGSSLQHDFNNPLYDESLRKDDHAAPATLTHPDVYYSSPDAPSTTRQAPEPPTGYDYAENPSGKVGSLSVYDSADDPTTLEAVYAHPDVPVTMETTNGAPPIHEYDYAFTEKPVSADRQVPPAVPEHYEMMPTDHYEFGPDFDS